MHERWPPRWKGHRGDPRIQTNAREFATTTTRPRWPMIVLKSPRAGRDPKVVDGLQIEGTFRAHQVPLLVDADHPEHVQQLESWMKSYKAEELFDKNGRLGRNWPSWRRRATGAWAPIRMPTAAACCATCACRTSMITP
jgi:phosphoketolase